MTRWISKLGLPLLGKELIEQAARKRTYVVRVLYASLLFFVAYLMFYETLRASVVSPMAALGRGREMFDLLVGLQFAGIYLFMPAITCGVIAHEKERASLQLLFLTRLGPWTILFEKLLSRLIPMTGFLLLSLPLLAYAYALGGISPERLWTGIWLLLITIFQVGAIALCCSAYFRTTAGAFVASYLVTALVSIGPGLAIIVLFLQGGAPGSTVFERFVMQSGLFDDATQILCPFCAPVQFLAGGTLGGPMRAGLLPHWVGVLVRSAPIVICGAAFIVMARRYVVRRAFIPPRNFLLNILKLIDGAFVRLNQNRVTRGIVVVEDKAHLPVDAPVAWRETTKRSLGRGRYLFRLLLVLEVPLLVFCFGQAIFATDMNLEALKTLIILLWFLAVLLVSVQAASLIARERTHQTLDVLCTTPLTSRQIVLQKFRSVQRLMRVLLVPFFTLILFKGWWGGIVNLHWWHPFDSGVYVVCAVLSVCIYLPMIAWLSLYIGMLVKSQARAVVAALGALVAWCLVPLVIVVLPLGVMFQPSSNSGFGFLFLLSPAAIVPLNEFSEWRELANLPWVAVVLNFMAYGMCLFLLRQLCLASADRLLGRVEYYAANDLFNDWHPHRVEV